MTILTATIVFGTCCKRTLYECDGSVAVEYLYSQLHSLIVVLEEV